MLLIISIGNWGEKFNLPGGAQVVLGVIRDYAFAIVLDLQESCAPARTVRFRVHNGCDARNCCSMTTVRRLKTYAGAQGYVYQYYFVGKRVALADDPAAPATEFIFDVTSDRKLTYSVSVFLSQTAVASWSAAHGRSLSDAEQYAAAKLRIFRAFDELENVKEQGRRLVIEDAVLEESLKGLGVE